MQTIQAFYNNATVTLLEKVELQIDGVVKYEPVIYLKVLKERIQNRYDDLPESRNVELIKLTIQTDIGNLDGKIHRFLIDSVQYEINSIIESPNVGSIKVYEVECRRVTD